MQLKTLDELYQEHQGKVSDKWSLYLEEYERLLMPYRKTESTLLEIGVQNGGSLEIWSKYFPSAKKIIGCDINPDCESLVFDDVRIAMVIGDANTDETEQKILAYTPNFQIIIDDGSHRSSDIVKSFSRYFPHLESGGIFIAEDLHCGYWQEFEGGLFDPFSSITFFKRLADVVNHEHWGIEKDCTDILRGIFERYDSWLKEDDLQQIHSVEFINSMCVIRKSKPLYNRLGVRIIAGYTETVVPGHLDLQFSEAPIFKQICNEWTTRSLPPDEELPLRIKELTDRDGQIALLNQELSNRDGQIALFNQALSDRDGQIALFNQVLSDRDGQIAKLKNMVIAYRSSTSWRMTLPVRIVGRQIRRIYSILKKKTLAPGNPIGGSLRVYVDKPRNGLINVVDDTCVVSGWAVDLNACSAADVRVIVGNVVYRPHPKPREDVRQAFGSTYPLPLETGFTAILDMPIGIHQMRIEIAEGKGLWSPVCKFLLVRLPRIFNRHQIRPGLSYDAWTGIEQNRLKAELPDIVRHIDVMLYKPEFTIIIDARLGDAADLKNTIRSIKKQIYQSYKLRVIDKDSGDSADSLPKGLDLLKDMSLSEIQEDFIVFMKSGQCLAINALYEFAAAINQYPDIDLAYGDEDSLAALGGRCDPFYKPAWSPDYLETFNYIGFPACFRTTLARGCFDNTHLYDFVLRFTERTERVWHISKVLGHGIGKEGQNEAGSSDIDMPGSIAALQGRLVRTGRKGIVSEHERYKGCYDIRLDLKSSPLVSVVIPTAGKTVAVGERQIDLLENIISQIRNISTYNNVEIIVIDNGDISHKQITMLAEADCKRITYSDPIFNISKKLNLGVSIANGDLLLLMNDDIEILTPSWIERLLEHFEKPHVGVVGAKLLYPNEQIQHVGVVHNFGNPDHVRRLFPRDDAGYFFSTCGVRNYSAVTGACMMTLTSLYREVGGYSEELAVSYNDADYCLKIRQKGFWVVYAPKAELTHMESQTRVASLDIKEQAWYHQRWAMDVVSDPFYNERFLTVASPTFEPCINRCML